MASQVRNVTCPACAKNFTQTGFQSHLRQTKDPHCSALYSEMVNMEVDNPEFTGGKPFEGDVFGGQDDYNDDDFGQLQDPESTGALEDDALEDDEDQGNFESGWEPERPGARAASSQTDEDPPTQQVGDHQPHDELINNTSRTHAEGRIAGSRIIVRYSDKNPHSQAGAPVKKT